MMCYYLNVQLQGQRVNVTFPLHMFHPSSILDSTILMIFGADYKSWSCFVYFSPAVY